MIVLLYPHGCRLRRGRMSRRLLYADIVACCITERWLEPGTEYAVRRTMPAEWYRGWAPEVAQAAPPADADVAQYSIQARYAPRQGLRRLASCQLCMAHGRLRTFPCCV